LNTNILRYFSIKEAIIDSYFSTIVSPALIENALIFKYQEGMDFLIRDKRRIFVRLIHVSAIGSRDSMSLEVLRMTKLEELERVVTSLTDEEYREFRRWFLEKDWEQWDRQIEEDSRTGQLDFLVREAFEAKKEGKLQEL